MSLAILFGGSSFEHEISIVSAITLKKVLSKTSLLFIFVDAKREFYLIDSANMTSKHFSSEAYKKSKKLSLEQGGFYILGGLFAGRKALEFDTLLNLIHGRDGEDGKIAGMMEFYGINFIGPRLEASVLSYSKLNTKLLASSLGIDTIDYQILYKDRDREINFDLPVIVKPVHLGSSIGVSIVKEQSELDYALDVAFEFDDEVLIEPFIEGIREYNLAGCKTDNWELSLIEEPQKEEFLDFDKKYRDFSREERVKEAKIDDKLKDKIESAFKKIYDPLFLGSLIRCDFFVQGENVYLNEINPIPGSMANYLFENFEALINRLSKALPKEKRISIDYRYIHSIQSAKGKA